MMQILVFIVPLYSYEFIQSYFQDSDAVALSAVEDGKGGYVMLIGVKWGSWFDHIGYGVMEVDSMGNYERYVGIYHGGSKVEVIGGYEFNIRDSLRERAYKDGSADGYTHGKIIRLRSGGYFAAVDSVYCYWDWGYYDVICEDHLIGYRINDDLGVEWRRNYPASGYVDELKESEDESGDIIILSGFNVEFIRIDSIGNIKVDRSYSTEGSAGDIIENTKGGYILCGGVYVRGLDSAGNIEWERNYDTIIIPGGSNINNWCWIGRVVSDMGGKGYKLSGGKVHYEDSTGEYIRTGFLMSIDDTGGFEWIRYYEGWDDEVSMSTVEDGYVVGVQRWFRDSSVIWRAGICKVDTEGNLEWLREYYYLYYFDMKPCEGGYLLSIASRDDAPYPVLVKTDTLGLVDEIGDRIIRPSASGFDYIIRSRRELTQLIRGNPAIRIYDLSGREIELKTYCFNLRRGIYLYEDKRRRGLMLLLMK